MHLDLLAQGGDLTRLPARKQGKAGCGFIQTCLHSRTDRKPSPALSLWCSASLCLCLSEGGFSNNAADEKVVYKGGRFHPAPLLPPRERLPARALQPWFKPRGAWTPPAVRPSAGLTRILGRGRRGGWSLGETARLALQGRQPGARSTAEPGQALRLSGSAVASTARGEVLAGKRIGIMNRI